jgi:hypothetical protein
MTFIETYVNDDGVALVRMIRESYTAVHGVAPPILHLGRVIVWEGRVFRQLELSSGASILEFEDHLFKNWKLPGNRARIQVGSVEGEVFTTPPQEEGEPAARVKEGGRCGREYTVKPFLFSDYDALA